jgi:3-phosphoshikimate 1-carboxyvinyltransferase
VSATVGRDAQSARTCYSSEMSSTRAVTVQPTARVRGRVRPPGDKSISHRYALLAAIAHGTTTIHGYSTGGDCAATLGCLRALGVAIDASRTDRLTGPEIRIEGRGLGGLVAPTDTLDAGNSGSTMRMLAGILAAHPFPVTLDGDASLRARPMRRVMAPLEQMGARMLSDNGRPPITVQGTPDLQPIDFRPEVPSAQVKSAVLLAGLHADGVTRVSEAIATRDHTERALRAFGVRIEQTGTSAAVAGRQALTGRRLQVPGDISSAAFWLAAAAALPDSDVTIEHVGLNPTRTAILDVLRRMGAQIDTTIDDEQADEPIGTIRIRHGGLRPAVIAPGEVPGLIDELPVLAALATHGGELTVSGAGELRVKESDRISALAEGLRRLGGEVDERPDGFHVRSGRRLAGGEADAKGDHRLAMAFAVAALGATAPSTILDAGSAAVSYPEFFSVLESLRA